MNLKNLSIVLLLVSLLISVKGKCQKSFFGISAAYTNPFIGNQESLVTTNDLDYFDFYDNRNAIVTETYTEKSGFKGGLYFQYPLPSNFFIRTAGQLQVVKFTREVVLDVKDDTKYILTSGSYQLPIPNKSRFFYAEVPICVGRTFAKDWVHVEVGVLNAMLLYSEQKTDGTDHINMGLGTTLDKYTMGVCAAATMRFTRYWGLKAEFSKYFSPIYTPEAQYAGKAGLSMISIGVVLLNKYGN